MSVSWVTTLATASTAVSFWMKAKGKAVLTFDIWLHYEVILFYPTLASRCNSLNKKGPKKILQKKTVTDRRRSCFFYIFPLFTGFNNHSTGEGVFPEYNWNGWIPQLRCLKYVNSFLHMLVLIWYLKLP